MKCGCNVEGVRCEARGKTSSHVELCLAGKGKGKLEIAEAGKHAVLTEMRDIRRMRSK